MDRKWLPLNALRAFEAAGQHLSFTAAANSLTVAQSAVSRHVIVLENFLGVALFERRPQQLVLTEAGQAHPARGDEVVRPDRSGARRSHQGKGPAEARAQGRAADLVRLSARGADPARFSRRTPRYHAGDRIEADPGPEMDGDIESRSSTPSRASPTRSTICCGWCARRSCAAQSCCKGSAHSDPAKFIAACDLLHVKLDNRPRHIFWEMFVRIDRPSRSRGRSRAGVRHPAARCTIRHARRRIDARRSACCSKMRSRRAGSCRPFEIWLEEGFGYYLTTHPEDLSNEAVALFRSWLIARFARDKARDATPAVVTRARLRRRSSSGEVAGRAANLGRCLCPFPAGVSRNLGADLAAGLTLAAIAIPSRWRRRGSAACRRKSAFSRWSRARSALRCSAPAGVLSVGADSTITPIFAGALAALAASGRHYRGATPRRSRSASGCVSASRACCGSASSPTCCRSP